MEILSEFYEDYSEDYSGMTVRLVILIIWGDDTEAPWTTPPSRHISPGCLPQDIYPLGQNPQEQLIQIDKFSSGNLNIASG